MNSQIGALCSKLNQFTEFMTPGATKSKTGGSSDNGERQGILGSSPGSIYFELMIFFVQNFTFNL